MTSDYLSVVYSENVRPRTDYPCKLVGHLTQRFMIKPGSTILDVGCGRGEVLWEFYQRGFKCIGIDLSRIDLPSFIRLPENIIFQCCDLTKDTFPVDSNTIDVVFQKSVIEHLFDPTLMLREMYRVLKPGGKLIILAPDWHSQWPIFYDDFTHVRPYTRTAVADLLAVAGFQNITVKRFCQLPSVWTYTSVSTIAYLMRRVLPVRTGRWLAQKTKVKFFRWAVELMILGYGEKDE